jgi:hypothetical protein
VAKGRSIKKVLLLSVAVVEVPLRNCAIALDYRPFLLLSSSILSIAQLRNKRYITVFENVIGTPIIDTLVSTPQQDIIDTKHTTMEEQYGGCHTS